MSVWGPLPVESRSYSWLCTWGHSCQCLADMHCWELSMSLLCAKHVLNLLRSHWHTGQMDSKAHNIMSPGDHNSIPLHPPTLVANSPLFMLLCSHVWHQ